MRVGRLFVLCLCVVLLADSMVMAQGTIGPATTPAAGARRGRGAGGAAAGPGGGGRGPAADVSADDVQTLAGFKVEMILRADRTENGSWISMAKSTNGRLWLGGQVSQPVTRVTITDGKVSKQEVFRLPVGEAMGMLEVGNSLYINGARMAEGQRTFGLWRIKNLKDDGTHDPIELLREWPRGSGEHGAHAILLAPDKKSLWIVNGNSVPVAPDASEFSPLRNYKDDRVLPRQEDSFMAGEMPPGSAVTQMDFDGKNAVVFAGGNRNTYDIAFNADGEIFGFDSDMEYDWGSPWYRPTRVVHLTSGADMGFRGGSGKYPTYYADSLPPVVNIGIGSPTGVGFGYGAKFPAKYQKALYIMDWTFGRLMAVHLKPHGASYEASVENFVAPKSLHETRKVPLNVTDLVIGDDGAMYFTIGGRSTQACLFRVTYVGGESTAPADAHDKEGSEARTLRRNLEAFHGKPERAALDSAWPYLSSDDRFIRYAARVAVEAQPVDQWKARALAEPNPQGSIEALLALARLGGADSYADVVRGLAKWDYSTLNDDLRLQKLRVLQVAISRNGKPSPELAQVIINELNDHFPAHTSQLSNELSQVLLAVNAPDAVAKTVKIMQTALTVEEQIAAMTHLRSVTTGWTPQLRQDYFAWYNQDKSNVRHPDYLTRWFDEAGRLYANGASYARFQGNARTDALATLSTEELNGADLASVLTAYRPPTRGARGGGARRGGPAVAEQPPRPVIQDWKMADIEPLLSQVSSGRNFQRAQQAFTVVQCGVCHAIAGTPASGGVGPDLTSIAARFRRRDILEAMIEPSKVLSDQFADTLLRTKSGEPFVGRVIDESGDNIVLQTNPMQPQRQEVPKANVESRALSTVSPMPSALLNVLTKDEILDLIAYLEAGGRQDHPNFKN